MIVVGPILDGVDKRISIDPSRENVFSYYMNIYYDDDEREWRAYALNPNLHPWTYYRYSTTTVLGSLVGYVLCIENSGNVNITLANGSVQYGNPTLE